MKESLRQMQRRRGVTFSNRPTIARISAGRANRALSDAHSSSERTSESSLGSGEGEEEELLGVCQASMVSSSR